MNESTTPTILYPILGSLTGMILGFTIFIITEKIIFLILCLTIGMILGMTIGQQKDKHKTPD